eukprot:365072-Chlamydomonas_euryale.AAC.24
MFACMDVGCLHQLLCAAPLYATPAPDVCQPVSNWCSAPAAIRGCWPRMRGGGVWDALTDATGNVTGHNVTGNVTGHDVTGGMSWSYGTGRHSVAISGDDITGRRHEAP